MGLNPSLHIYSLSLSLSLARSTKMTERRISTTSIHSLLRLLLLISCHLALDSLDCCTLPSDQLLQPADVFYLFHKAGVPTCERERRGREREKESACVCVGGVGEELDSIRGAPAAAHGTQSSLSQQPPPSSSTQAAAEGSQQRVSNTALSAAHTQCTAVSDYSLRSCAPLPPTHAPSRPCTFPTFPLCARVDAWVCVCVRACVRACVRG